MGLAYFFRKFGVGVNAKNVSIYKSTFCVDITKNSTKLLRNIDTIDVQHVMQRLKGFKTNIADVMLFLNG